MRIGINGFGRIGRLVFRALWNHPGIELVHINDPAGDAAAGAHLLEFDSVHGRWNKSVDNDSDGEGFSIDGHSLSWSQHRHPTDVPWQALGVEMVLEASGRFKSPETLCGYFDQCGLKRVVVACPVNGVSSCNCLDSGGDIVGQRNSHDGPGASTGLIPSEPEIP